MPPPARRRPLLRPSSSNDRRRPNRADRPRLPSPPPTRSVSPETTEILDVLRPYEQLLPALRGVKLPVQQRLHRALYTAGCTAAEALETYLKDKSLALKQLEGGDASTTTSSESEELRLLLNYVSVEMAAENLRKVCSGPDGKILLRDAENKILNEVAAAALAAFAAAASRRPSTKHVEYLMNPTASMGAADDAHSQSSQLTGVVAAAVSERTAGGRAADAKGTTPVFPPCNTADHLDASRHSDTPIEDFDYTDALLRFACTVGHVDIVKWLVEIRGCPEYQSAHKSTMLMEACCAGQTKVVQALLDQEADVNASGHTALMEASSAGHLEIVEELLQHGADIFAIVENVDFKESSLSLASYRGHVEVVSALLRAMPECPERMEELHAGLLEAAMDGHVDVARVLLDGGAPVNLPTENFESPLTLAACGGHYDLVQLLAAREGHQDVVELLLDNGANVNSKIEEGIETPLTLAASGGYLRIVEMLVSHGGDLSVGERTPLYEATQEGHVDVTNNMELIKLFLENGAQISCFSKDGRTPLMEAAKQGHLEVIEYLVNRGACVNVVSPTNDATALSLACLFGRAEVTKYLLKKGANAEVMLKDSVSCIIEASRNGNTDCARIVLDHMGVKGKEAHGKKPNGTISDIPMAKPSELSQRPKIKPVHKLQNQQQREPITQTPPHRRRGDEDERPVDAHHLETTRRPAHGHRHTTTTKQRHPAGGSATTTTTTATITATPVDPQNAAEILQQFPAELMSSMMAAAANASISNSANANAMAVDESMLAHFFQRSLIEPKRRDASWTDQELAAFKDLVRQKMRTLNPAAMTSPSLTTSVQPQQITDLIDEHQEFMVANMLSGANLVGLNAEMGECPGCAHQHAAQYASSVHSKLGNAPPPNVLPAAGGSGGRSVADSLANTTSILSAIQNARSGVDDEMDRLSRAAVDQSGQPPLKRKGSAIKARPAASSTSSDTSGAYAGQRVSGIRRNSTSRRSADSPVITVKGTSVIQSPVYYNRTLTGTGGASALTPEQQQQIIFYQQQEYHNLQNIQTAAGHHHVTSTTGSFQSATPCHPGAHVHPVAAAAAQMSNLGQQMQQASNRAARRTTQSGKHPKTCTGHGANGHALNGVAYGDFQSDPEGAKLHADDYRDDVSSYVDVQTDQNNDTALTVACVGGHASLVSLLIQRGANVEHRDKKGFTPLILAATGGHVDCCKLLIEAGCVIDAQSERTKDTALSLACSGGRKEVVELLLRFGANKEHRNVSDYTPLSLAASGGYVDIIHLLLDAGAEINSRTGSKLGISPLMLAAMNGHDAATLMLLERGSDINAQIETNRNTALTLACFQGRTEVVRLLLKFGANVEHRAKTGLTPLMEAANGGYTDVGALLLKAGADPNASPVPTSRDTALTIAADKGHSTFVSMLLNQQAFIDVKNKKGCTPLFLACGNGHLETVKILVKRRADVDALDNRKTSPLVAAFRKGFVKVVEFMVQHVNQFPNDLECARYYNNLSDGDLAAKVKDYSTNAGNNSAEESEWLSASKRRASSRPGKETAAAASTTATNVDRSSSSKDPLRDLVRVMKENPQVSEAWSMTEPNSKRRAFAITVSSSTVARIIGRAGQNINAIREATNAHIEVEKIATRREQSTRQITVKGSPDSIRNAITMMDLLVRDSDAHVNDVIRRVTRTDVVSSPATVAGAAPVVLPPMIWNTPSATSASNLADDTGFAGLFGADSKNAASLWLPPSSSSSAGVKDDTWLDSAALFSSLGIGEMGGGNAPSVAPIGSKSAFGSQSTGAARPHSSTDWTAAGSPWASSGMFGGPPSAQQQQQLGTAHWSTATSQAMSNGPPGRDLAAQDLRAELLGRPSAVRSGDRAPDRPVVSSASSSTRMPANWQAVFNQMAQQLGDANVYAPYATAAMDDRLQFNGLMRAAGGMSATEQPPQPSMGGIAPPHSVAATPQAANHSAVIKSYLESMPKDFDLNLSALSNSEQLRQSFYAAQMAAHQQQQQPGGPPPGFGAMPPAPRASSMTPVQQLPLPNGNAAAAAAAGWSSQQPAAAYGQAAAFDSILTVLEIHWFWGAIAFDRRFLNDWGRVAAKLHGPLQTEMIARGVRMGGGFCRGILAAGRVPSTSHKFVRSMFIQKILDGTRTYDFTNVQAAKISPLALQLLRITGVKGVFFGEDFVSVTKSSEDEEWALIKPDVFATIMDYLQAGKPVISDVAASEPTDTTILDTDDDTVAMIKELLESRIKPMVQEDGGDVLYRGFDDGVLKLKLQGSCTGCPSSSVTLKAGIKNMMQFYVPDVKDVIEVTDQEDDLAAAELHKLEEELEKKMK
ncbi:NFU1 iron-sulfur cluster scaffold-like protein, mitochondrial [Aphelenchoides fujianensis]|nr:NFU1 iron-sulfur cluster scaffold-like protein, mitochondrial [Aphelenchoides fujianensis]